MSEPQEVADILDGLTDPTADEVYQAVREYDTRHVVAAVGSKADAAGGGGSQTITRASFSLSSAQVLALGSAPITLIPAPAAGTANIPLYMVTFCPFATAYAFAANLELRFGADWTFGCGGLQASLAYGDGTSEFSWDPIMNYQTGISGGPYPGTVAFELHALGAVTDGTGTVKGYVDYLALATT